MQASLIKAIGKQLTIEIPQNHLKMKSFYCSALLVVVMQFCWAQDIVRTGFPVQIVPVPVLTDSLGKIDAYIQPISKKIKIASEELNRQTLKLVEEWKQVDITPSEEFEKLVRSFNHKLAKITNNNTAGYLDSLSIRLDYIDRKILQDELVQTSDVRLALSILANDFDHAACIRRYIQERKQVLNNSLNRKPGKLEKQIASYDAKVQKIKAQFCTPLTIEIAFDDILAHDAEYQSYMQEMVLPGARYGIFGKMD